MPLSRAEIEELVNGPLLAHLAVMRNGKPHVTPVWVYFEKGVFYFTTRGGRSKGVAIRENPNVAVSIATDTNPYKAVVFEGAAEIVEAEKWVYLGHIVSKYVTSRFGKNEGERLLEAWRNEPDRVAFSVRPTKVLSWDYGKGDLKRQDEGESMSTKF
jgi:PPOX class probable F420-dependent enzyme